MTESFPETKIIVIPAKNESPQEQAKKRNLRVAAYGDDALGCCMVPVGKH